MNLTTGDNKDVILRDASGKIIYYGVNKFKSEIIDKGACFICGAHQGTKEFNDEHIIPNRVLSYLELKKQSIENSNGGWKNYSKFKISCCKECNSFLGKTIEIPVSKLLKRNYESFIKELNKNFKNNLFLIFKRLALIFFKISLKDKNMKINIKSRKSDKLGDILPRSELHHLHCIVRSDYVGSTLDKSILGSICFLPITNQLEKNLFNFMDHHLSQTIMIKLGEIGIVAVLNDRQAVTGIFTDNLKKINGTLTYLQLIEIFSHFASLRMCIKTKIDFLSEISISEHGDLQKYIIKSSNIDKINMLDEINDLAPKIKGKLFYQYSSDILNNVGFQEDIINGIKSGERSFLFNNGDFINYGLLTDDF